MNHSASEPAVPRVETPVGDGAAILHPTVQAFLEALAAWRFRRAVEAEARAAEPGPPPGGASPGQRPAPPRGRALSPKAVEPAIP